MPLGSRTGPSAGARRDLAPPAADQLARRPRQQHLPAVAGGSDPRRTVHVRADISLSGHERRPRVDPDPHADRPAASASCASVAAATAPGAVANATKNASPCVSTSTPPCRRTPHAARGDALPAPPRTLRAQLVQQPRRPLHVREQKRHRPLRQVAHKHSEPRRPTCVQLLTGRPAHRRTPSDLRLTLAYLRRSPAENEPGIRPNSA